MPAMATRDVRWAARDGRGLEHLRLHVEPAAVRADSVIIAVADDGRRYLSLFPSPLRGEGRVRGGRRGGDGGGAKRD